MPRLAPVTTAVVPVRSNRRRHRDGARAGDIDQHLHRAPRLEVVESLVGLARATMRRDEGARSGWLRRRPARRPSRSLRARRRGPRGCAVRARTPAAGRLLAAAGGWRRRRACRAPSASAGRAGDGGGSAGDLEDDIGAGAAVHSSTLRLRSCAAGIERAKPRSAICARRRSSSSTTTTSAPACRATRGDEHADRAAAEDDHPVARR